LLYLPLALSSAVVQLAYQPYSSFEIFFLVNFNLFELPIFRCYALC
jgi:hypothetical protein